MMLISQLRTFVSYLPIKSRWKCERFILVCLLVIKVDTQQFTSELSAALPGICYYSHVSLVQLYFHQRGNSQQPQSALNCPSVDTFRSAENTFSCVSTELM